MLDLGRRVIFIASIVALTACARSSPPTADPVADKAAVEAVSLAWKAAYNARDAAAVTALYGDDAVLSAPGARAVRGKAAIGDYFVKTIAQFSTSGLTVTDEPMGETVTSCDLAWHWKTYTVTDGSGAVVDAGKLVTLFQRTDGKWLIVGDTWNSDGTAVPPVAPAATSAGASSAN